MINRYHCTLFSCIINIRFFFDFHFILEFCLFLYKSFFFLQKNILLSRQIRTLTFFFYHFKNRFKCRVNYKSFPFVFLFCYYLLRSLQFVYCSSVCSYDNKFVYTKMLLNIYKSMKRISQLNIYISLIVHSSMVQCVPLQKIINSKENKKIK